MCHVLLCGPLQGMGQEFGEGVKEVSDVVGPVQHNEVVCNDHWPQCPFYPIPCPNGCEIMALERGDLDAHLMLCSLEEVECEFSQSGCKVKLVREEMERHLADNLQRHMLMMNRAGQEKMEQKERKIEELEARLEEKDRQIQKLREEKDRQIQELREEKDRQIREQSQQVEEKMEKERQIRDGKNQQLQKRVEEQIQGTQGMVAQVEKQLTENVLRHKARIGSADAQFTTTAAFQGVKRRVGWCTSPPVDTHPGGYRIGIKVRPNGLNEGKGTHVTVYLCTAKGENDDHLKWPADCTITLQLLNQHRDQDHITVSRRLQWNKPTSTALSDTTTIDEKFVAHKDLDWNAGRQTQYLQNDCLKWRITDIRVHGL